MAVNNPFIITSEYISPAYFCDREEETEILVSNILNGRNTVLISPRRMGKSGLIQHVFSQDPIKRAYRTFGVDLYAASTLSELVFFLGKTITDNLKSAGRKRMEEFFSLVKSLRPGFKIDQISGEIRFDLSLGEITRPKDSLEEIFFYLEQSKKPCVVAIDEFQQIAEFPEKNILELLRTHIQKCKKTYFIFAGSKRRMMDKIFHNPSEPFYMSSAPLFLDSIGKDPYRRFAERHFSNAGKEIEADCFDYAYDLFEGHTWYVQRILNELFAWTDKGGKATEKMATEVVDYIIKLSARGFEEQFSGISSSQKHLLIAVAKEGKARAVTSMGFVKKHALKSPSTVQSATRALYENETLSKEKNAYSITNRFFSLWINKQYSGAK